MYSIRKKYLRRYLFVSLKCLWGILIEALLWFEHATSNNIRPYI